MQKLSDIPVRTRVRVVEFDDQLEPKFRRRLEDLGFVEDVEVECLKTTPFKGPKVYRVGGCIFSLADELTRQIRVSVFDPVL